MTADLPPIRFKGQNSVFSNFHTHFLYDPTLKLWGNSIEQLYQYVCAVHNGYEELADCILEVPFTQDAGVICKTLAKSICVKTDMWRESKANIIFEMMKLKFDQHEPFRRALMATDRPLIHPVSSSYWGTGHNGQGQNVCGKLLMDLRSAKRLEWGPSSLKVVVFTDSIMKYLPQQMNKMEFAVHSLPGGSVNGPRKMSPWIQSVLSSEEDAPSQPSAVVLHVGTNDLNHINSVPQHINKVLVSHIALVQQLVQHYPKETIILVSSILPRLDDPDLQEWSKWYNHYLSNEISSLGDRVRFVNWTNFPHTPIYYQQDGVHLSSEHGLAELHWSLFAQIEQHLSPLRNESLHMKTARELNHLQSQRRKYTQRKAKCSTQTVKTKVSKESIPPALKKCAQSTKTTVSKANIPPPLKRCAQYDKRPITHDLQNRTIYNLNSEVSIVIPTSRYRIKHEYVSVDHNIFNYHVKDNNKVKLKCGLKCKAINQQYNFDSASKVVHCPFCSCKLISDDELIDHVLLQHSEQCIGELSEGQKGQLGIFSGGAGDPVLEEVNTLLMELKQKHNIRYLHASIQKQSYRVKMRPHKGKDANRYFPSKTPEAILQFVNSVHILHWFNKIDSALHINIDTIKETKSEPSEPVNDSGDKNGEEVATHEEVAIATSEEVATSNCVVSSPETIYNQSNQVTVENNTNTEIFNSSVNNYSKPDNHDHTNFLGKLNEILQHFKSNNHKQIKNARAFQSSENYRLKVILHNCSKPEKTKYFKLQQHKEFVNFVSDSGKIINWLIQKEQSLALENFVYTNIKSVFNHNVYPQNDNADNNPSIVKDSNLQNFNAAKNPSIVKDSNGKQRLLSTNSNDSLENNLLVDKINTSVIHEDASYVIEINQDLNTSTKTEIADPVHITPELQPENLSQKKPETLLNEHKSVQIGIFLEKFDLETVKNILYNVDSYPVSTIPPFKPCGGEVYLVNAGGDKGKLDDWRCDQYRWNVHNGIHRFPKNDNPEIFKCYHKLNKESSFQRHAWWLADIPHVVLIQYLGDHMEYSAKPHGNSKGKKEHIRTCPSVNKIITNNILLNDQNPSTVYQKLSSKKCPTDHHPVLRPKNMKQVRNNKFITTKKAKLSHDDYYNLILIAQELDDYVFEVVCYPDLICFFGNCNILKEFDKILQLHDYDPQPELYCSYDTTYNMGDFYVTPVVFRHPLFQNNPIFPLAFMLHERRYQTAHEAFLRHLVRKVPQLNKVKIPFVVDKEVGLTNAIETVLPFPSVLQCWNHIKSDWKFWLGKHGVKGTEKAVYMNDLNLLLETNSEEEFNSAFIRLSAKWSASVVDHFENNIKQGILKYSGKWILQKHKLLNPYKGITNNNAESMNLVLKRLIDWKERPIEIVVLCINFLQNYYWNEMLRGFCDLGNYSLKDEHRDLVRDSSEVLFPDNIYLPEEIIEKCKSRISQAFNYPSEVESKRSVNNLGNLDINNDSIDNKSQSLGNLDDNNNSKHSCNEFSLESNSELQDIPNVSQNNCIKNPLGSNNNVDRSNWTQAALAAAVVEERRIEHVPKMKSFVIKGSKSDTYAVSLNPKEVCQCPATGTCYHILAAKLSIGIDIQEKKKTVNMTQLTRNKRKKADKKSGRKRPRTHDYEIVPAPDSVLGNLTNNTNLSNLSFQSPKIQYDDCAKTAPIMNETLSRTPLLKSILKTPQSKHKGKNITFKENLILSSPLPPTCTSTPRRQKTRAKKALNFDNTIISQDLSPNFKDNLKTTIDLTNNLEESLVLHRENWGPIELGLQESDRNILLMKGQWLNNNIINASLSILHQQFPDKKGLQNCDLIPIFNEKQKKWVYVHKFEKLENGIQIHFNGTNHWYTSAKLHSDPYIYILDSGRNTKLTPSSEIQLAQLYGKPFSNCKLPIQFSKVQPQNAGDCGIHAIANAVEFCFNNFVGKEDIQFDKELMRDHCITCIENHHFEPFPKRKRVLKSLLTQTIKTIQIIINCKCGLPDSYENMIQCGNNECGNWYHYNCAGYMKTPIKNEKWKCNECH